MSAIFGIEERDARGFIDQGVVCFPRTPDGKSYRHTTVSPIMSEDVVFIKHCTTPSSLQIKAIGIVHSDFPAKGGVDFCLPVEWVWMGEKVIENFDEKLAVSGDTLYEEHDILVQREIINLLPQKYQLHPEW